MQVRNRKIVRDYDSIKNTVVTVESPNTGFLRYHMENGCSVNGRTTNKSKIKYVFRFVLGDLKLIWRKMMESSFDRASANHYRVCDRVIYKFVKTYGVVKIRKAFKIRVEGKLRRLDVS